MKKGLLAVVAIASCALGAQITEKTQLGGYGENHFNYVKPSEGEAQSPVMDFHRYVLFIGHSFTPQWKIFSELELEHNFVADNQGELKLEQAYIEYSPLAQLNVQGGVVLVSSGLVNEYHEPTEFLSVERPTYHNSIIPTTWYGGGLALYGSFAKSLFQYKAVVVEGLDDRLYTAASAIRKGRQEGYLNTFDNLLVNGAIDFVGVPGLKVGTSAVVNSNLKDIDTAQPHLYEQTLLTEVHVSYKKNGIWAQAEFGTINYWEKEGATVPVEASQGIYADVAYDVAKLWGAKELQLYPFVRYSQINPAGKIFTNDAAATPFTQEIMGGLSLMPIKEIVVKVDLGLVQKQFDPGYTHRFNIGLGYAF